jgi:SnoaL-like domain
MLTVDEWLTHYRRAWETADDQAVAGLFAENATYRSNPFRDPHHGRAAIAEYWRTATRTQTNVKVRFGRPFIDGDRVAVEWWTEMEDEGTPILLVGALILQFQSDGLCRALREYYNLETGIAAPPVAGWGE